MKSIKSQLDELFKRHEDTNLGSGAAREKLVEDITKIFKSVELPVIYNDENDIPYIPETAIKELHKLFSSLKIRKAEVELMPGIAYNYEYVDLLSCFFQHINDEPLLYKFIDL